MIAAHPTRASNEALRVFLDSLSTYVRAFDSTEKRVKDDLDFIKEKFGYPEDDIKVSTLFAITWLLLTCVICAGMAEDCRIPSRLLSHLN